MEEERLHEAVQEVRQFYAMKLALRDKRIDQLTAELETTRAEKKKADTERQTALGDRKKLMKQLSKLQDQVEKAEQTISGLRHAKRNQDKNWKSTEQEMTALKEKMEQLIKLNMHLVLQNNQYCQKFIDQEETLAKHLKIFHVGQDAFEERGIRDAKEKYALKIEAEYYKCN